MSFSFFGKVDYNSKGKIGSEYPAWLMRAHMEDLQESIGQKERALKANMVDAANKPYHMETLNSEKQRLGEIMASKPTLTVNEKSKAAAEYHSLEKEIAASMYTRADMKLGLADAHEEARRMVNPCISVDKVIAKACNVKVTKDGKVSRNSAVKMFKIIGTYLGAQTNAESLRKSG